VYSQPNSLGVALCLLVPLVLLLLAASRCGLRSLLRRVSPGQRALVLVCLAVAVVNGGQKGAPAVPARVLELLTVLQDGTLKDHRGKAASGVQQRAVAAFLAESSNIVAAVGAVVADAEARCDELIARMATNDYSVAYVQMSLPRGTPEVPNHNLMITFERTERVSSNQVDRLVWFSSPPVTNVTVYARYRTAAGHDGILAPTTNHWPATETVNGVECVRYSYTLPTSVQNYAVVPSYEGRFGGPLPGMYLNVPSDGVVVTSGGEDHMPFTGTDTYLDGTRITYQGGIAVELVQGGIVYRGVNP